MSEAVSIPTDTVPISARWNRSENSQIIMILAHGAGAGMDHAFMTQLAEKLAEAGITVLRFNFPYIDQGRHAPDSPKKAQKAIVDVVQYVAGQSTGQTIIIGGKSYGGRMASHCAADQSIPEVAGLVFYGFPLHAPGRDSKDRASHLAAVEIPLLFLQGTNDKLANIEMITEVSQSLGQKATLESFESADHSFKVPKRTGLTQDDMISLLVEKTMKWSRDLAL